MITQNIFNNLRVDRDIQTRLMREFTFSLLFIYNYACKLVSLEHSIYDLIT